MARAAIIFLVAAALTAAAVVLVARQAYRTSCEVCITFRGASQCREAYGPSRKEAVRTATDNACAFLASGMTASVECQNTEPDRVTCSGE
jgi:hypothetical protein